MISCTYTTASAALASHYHDCHQLLYLIDGAARVSIDGKAAYARGGSLILINRFEEHAVTIDTSPCRRYICRISPQVAMQQAESHPLFAVLFDRAAPFHHIVDTRDHAAEFEALFARMADEHSAERPFADELRQLLLRQLLIALYRLEPSLFRAPRSGVTEVVRQIQSRFAADCRTAYSLRQLAADYHLSPYYLAHVFKTVTGYPLMTYLQNCRLAAAKTYLAQTSLRIGEIVEACGFSDGSNFSRTFKRQTGLSPKDFREKYAESG